MEVQAIEMPRLSPLLLGPVLQREPRLSRQGLQAWLWGIQIKMKRGMKPLNFIPLEEWAEERFVMVTTGI
jgi:hypothetical protein